MKVIRNNMLILHDSIDINAAPEAVFNFFNTMSTEQYRTWHPEHEEFRWIAAEGAQVGNKFYFKETIGGHTLEKTVVFTKIEPGRYLEFAPTNWFFRLVMPRLFFKAEPTATGCRFIAEIHIRTGPIGAWLYRKGAEYRAVTKHMREEGQNLKAILEQ